MRSMFLVGGIAVSILCVLPAEAGWRRVGAGDCKVLAGKSVVQSDNTITDNYWPAAGSGENYMRSPIGAYLPAGNTQIICPVVSDSTIATQQIAGIWLDVSPNSYWIDPMGYEAYGGVAYKYCTMSFDGTTVSCSGSQWAGGGATYLQPSQCPQGRNAGYQSLSWTNASSSGFGWSTHPYDYPYIYLAMGNPPTPAASGCGGWAPSKFIGYGIWN